MFKKDKDQVINKNKKTFVEFCLDVDLTIMHTQFLYQSIHKITKKIKIRKKQSIIDYLIVNKKKTNRIKDATIR